MGLRNARPITLRPLGLVDAIDGSDSPLGSMQVLQDLVPNPSTAYQFVPRPASLSLYNFAAFTTPAGQTALNVIGTKAYGFISSARNGGKDEPYVYDLAVGANIAVSNVTAANCPTTQPTTGDWTPPQVCMVSQGRIVFTHPGYDGVTNMIGWLDISSYTSSSGSGTTVSGTKAVTYGTSVLTIQGYQIGYLIAAASIPANTYITNISADGLTVTISNNATASATVTTTVTGGTPAAPLYGAGNTAPFPLVARPACVGQFNGRAYFGVLNTLAWTDSGFPTQVTNANQALTLGDDTPVTAVAGLPLNNTVTGGSVASLYAFKGAGFLYQITGDSALNTLAQNAVEGSVGTLAPNTICSTPEGLAYIAPDGLRMLTLAGQCTPPIGADGEGVNVPFLNAVSPSRMCAAYNANVLRISVQNGNVNSQPIQEYWLHLKRKIWTGPHSFPASLIQPFTGGGGANTFVMAAAGINAKLWQSSVIPSLASTYTENSVAMTFAWQPTLFPDNQEMSGNQVVEASIALGLPDTQNLTFFAADELGNQLDLISVQGSGNASSIWDAFNWGAATWGTATAPLQQYPLEWHQPLVFKQMTLRCTGMSIAGQVLGNLYVRAAPTGYLLK